ncbi:MAG: type I-F CRISPR-associated helicase Cas3 [Gammaproteobacteria bacterium]|nr:MAG: type I-F CRISPR-associated helicase Cas3 [Gammaproteobacteria bacterium]
MIVTFVSQCEKNALKKTRRVLDAFANRIGDNVWQTAITEEGLRTVYQLLKDSASRSTAVSCHRISTRKLTKLVWIVGNKRKFNELGYVAVNRTRKNILHNEWENNWHYASSIQIIATISALLHDIGKSTVGFQNKLHNPTFIGDPYRHEWISLKLFELMIVDCDTDEQWLQRFVKIKEWLKNNDIAKQLPQVETDKTNIANLPPLAQWVAWLIVSHHRLPPAKDVFYRPSARERLKNHSLSIKKPLNKFYQKLTPIEYWVKNPKTLDEKPQKLLKQFWQTDNLVIDSPTWQKHIKRWANKALQDVNLQQLSKTAEKQQQPISDPFLLYTSRLCLMIGDHNYSCLKKDDKRRINGDKNWRAKLIANTDRKTGDIKQALDEHLLGVASFTAHFARFLPKLTTQLPTLQNHNPLAKSTGIERFQWQNHAFKLAREVQKDSEENGFFGINMASTGCGKTIGNARIMYGLADHRHGARFTIALGLRVLTLQTGLSFRKDLQLSDEQLAILVGGGATKKLFEYNQQDGEIIGIVGEKQRNEEDKIANSLFTAEESGSESIEQLIDEQLDADIDTINYDDYADLNIDTLLNDHKARQLLFAPIVTCTIDHIIQASECKRGGKYIPPILRLLSSDLILDEPDDFNQEDLPALCRLVHLAGLFGSRVLFSSATLTPDMLAGLYQAYLAGRTIYNHSQNKPKPNVVCAWFDEQNKAVKANQCSNLDEFNNAHAKFVKKRCQYLQKQSIRRRAEILPLTTVYDGDRKNIFYQQLCNDLMQGVIQLHQRYHKLDKSSQKQVSIGLVRIANINNIIPIAKQFFNTDNPHNLPTDTHLHIACYHSRQLLILRNHLESRLDKILKRDEDKPQNLFNHQDIQNALQKSEAKNHIFIVLGSPVTEVGRDHDYDWAIVEPSSMRSIIQLAGRVWRHRPNKAVTNPNIMIMQYNLRYLKNKGSQPVFIYPGFETNNFKPHSYDISELITENQLARIDAQARINNNFAMDSIITNLAQLEHKVMQDTLNNSQLNYVNAYWSNTATAHKVNTHLQQLSPFRYQPKQQQDWILVPREDEDNEFDAYYAEDVYENKLSNASKHNKDVRSYHFNDNNPNVSTWLTTSLTQVLSKLQDYEDLGINGLATRYATVSLDHVDVQNNKNWQFCPFLGFERG